VLLATLSRVETHDAYGAMWLGAECAGLLSATIGPVASARERLSVQARALGYQPIVDRLSGAAARTASGAQRAVLAA
jgi:hypothetical protein